MGLQYDHAGVIVLLREVPHLLEHTAAGARLRRYDARVKASRAREVVVRPLGLVLSSEQQAAVQSFLRMRVSGLQQPGSESTPLPVQPYTDPAPNMAQLLHFAAGLHHVGDLLQLGLVDKSANPSLAFVLKFYSSLGLTQGSRAARADSKRAAPAELSMAQLSNMHYQPFEVERYQQPVWVRDMR